MTALYVHITLPNDFSYFKGLQESTIAKEPKPTMILTKPINIENKNVKLFPQNDILLCTEITYFLSPVLSPIRTEQTHNQTETSCCSDDFISKIDMKLKATKHFSLVRKYNADMKQIPIRDAAAKHC